MLDFIINTLFWLFLSFIFMILMDYLMDMIYDVKLASVSFYTFLFTHTLLILSILQL